ALVVVVGVLVDEGAEEGVLVERVTNLDDLLGLREELAEELVVHLSLNVHTRARRALLPAHPEGRAHHAQRGVVKVCLLRDDGRVLAAISTTTGLGYSVAKLRYT